MYFNDLFKLFVETVMTVEGVDVSNYNSSRLKARLKKRFLQLIFRTGGGRNKGESVLKENLGAIDVLCKKLGEVNVDEDKYDIQFELKPADVKGNILQNLFSAAIEIRSLLENCPGLQFEWPPLSTGISFEATLDLVPVNLFNFLVWSLGLSRKRLHANCRQLQKI